MRFTSSSKRQPPAVIIVPLIDILLVLLIFLMVTSTFQRKPAVRLTLPKSKQSAPVGTDENLVLVSIAKDSPHFFLGIEPITLDKLRRDLLAVSEENPNAKLSVAADQGAPFGEVIKVLDIAHEASFKSINAFTRAVE